MTGTKFESSDYETSHGVIHDDHHSHHHNSHYIHHFTTPHGRDPKLHFYLQLAHKGHGVGKVHHYTHRLYRHFNHKAGGLHDYQNLLWDPNIYRGRTFKDFREKNVTTTVTNANSYCLNASKKTKKESLLQNNKPRRVPRVKIGGIIRPTTDDIIGEDFTGQKSRQQYDSRSEIDKFIIEQFVPPVYKECDTQVDDVRSSSSPLAARGRRSISVARGEFKSTQADIPYIGSAEMEDPIHPLVSNVGNRILEQSLLEVSEEFELAQIRSEIGKYVDKRRARQARITRLIENECSKAEYRSREKVLREKEERLGNEAENRVGAIAFSSQIGNKIEHRTFEELQKNSFFQKVGKNLDDSIRPWLHTEMFRHINVPRMVLDNLILDTETAKKLEFEKDAPPTEVVPLQMQNNTDLFGETGGEFVEPVSMPTSTKEPENKNT